MQWTAPSEKDDATESLERNLRDAADQFRANSGLRSQESVAKALIFNAGAVQRGVFDSP
jgi:hypothetical protein